MPTPTHISTDYSFIYDTTEAVSAAALAESLLALDTFAAKAPHLLRTLLPDIGKVEAQLLVSSISIGSYKESFIYRIFLGKGKSAERKLEKLRKQLHLHKMSPSTLAYLLITSTVIFGIYQFSKPGQPSTLHIENSFNSIGAPLQLSGEDLKALLETSIPNKEELRRATVRLIRPESLRDTGDLHIKSEDFSISIPKESLADVPPTYTKAPLSEPEEHLPNAPIIIRALDLDRPGTGWAGILPELSEKRLPVEVSPAVNPAHIPAGKIFYASVTVIHSTDSHGNKSPKRYIIEAIAPPAE